MRGAIVAAFGAAVAAATGFTVASDPTITAVTGVSADGSVVALAALSGGAIAGLVIMCVVVAVLIVAGVYVYLKKSQKVPVTPHE
jgi:hypothetical protein